MNHVLRVALGFGVLLLLASCRAGGPLPANRANTEQELIQLERQYLEARLTNDRAFLDRIVADDFVSVNSGGAVAGKEEHLQNINMTPGGERFTALDLEDVRARVYGDAGIVTGIRKVSVAQGQFQLRFTHVFVRRGGTWQLVSSQVTPVG
jgi:hypothetical protein